MTCHLIVMRSQTVCPVPLFGKKSNRPPRAAHLLARTPAMSLETSANADEENENCTRGFPVKDVDVSRALRASDARLNRKWERAMVDSGRRCRDDDGRPGDYVRAFARANGIGRASRRELWMAWSGGEGKRAAAMRRGEASYAATTARDRAEEDGGDEDGGDDDGGERGERWTRCFEQIDLDVPRTFPEHEKFREGGDGLVRLRRVLRAAARTSAKTSGYVQGMNYLAGFLLCVYDGEHEDDEECAYWVLRCVTEDMFPGYFEPGLKTLRSDLEELDYRFSRVSEEAHGKLQSMGLAVKFFTARWLMCGLVGCAAAPIVLRVWDLLFVDADRQPRETLLRCSLAILALQAPFIRAAEDMNASVECIREAGSTIDNIEAYLQRVSDLRGRHFPSKPVEAPTVATPSRKRTRYEPPPPTPARAAMTPVGNTLYASLISFFSPTPNKPSTATPSTARASGLAPKRLWSFGENGEVQARSTKRKRDDAETKSTQTRSTPSCGRTPRRSPRLAR